MKILYVGSISRESTCLQRYRALQTLGHDLKGVSTILPFQRSTQRWLRFTVRFFLKLPICLLINYRIRKLTNRGDFDLIWIDKGLMVFPATLMYSKRKSDASQLVSYSPDDMLNPANQSPYYLKSIPIFDFHVTTKSYNVPELKQLGAKKVIFIGNAYDPQVHRPVEPDRDDSTIVFADVGFVGAYEKERVEFMERLADAGIDIVFCCPALPFGIECPKKLRISLGFLEKERYAKQICAFKINLGFLRKVNRDLQTTRSIEIPACGAFMLAERTVEHEELFEDGKEASFFSNYEELFEKIQFYLANEKTRLQVARAGLCRVQKSGYSNRERLDKILINIKNF